jgi:hypothetical protein
MNILKRWVEKIAERSEIVAKLRRELKFTTSCCEAARDAKDDTSSEIERLRERLEQAEGEALRRRRDWRRPEEAMDAEQLAAAFDVPADQALWQAVHQELDAEIMGAVDDATAPGCADRDFRSGGVDALRGFQRRLIDARSKAQVAKKKVASSEE